MTFVQVKACNEAGQSAKSGLLDGLAFVGGTGKRAMELHRGRIAFRVIIPSDQYDELIRAKKILTDGTPDQGLIDKTLKQALAESLQAGPGGSRIRNALADAPEILRTIKVERGPVTYAELNTATRLAGKSLRMIAKSTPQLTLSEAISKRKAEEVAKAALPIKQTKKSNLTGRYFIKVFGGLGVVGGVFQVKDGTVELRDGKEFAGLADVASGTLTALSGATALQGGLQTSAILAGTAVVTDGVKDVYVGYQTSNGDLEFIGSVKIAAGGAMAIGVGTGNPVLAGAGAASYVVVVIYENRDAVRQLPEDIYSVITSTKKSGKQVVKETLRTGEQYLIDYYSLETQDRVLCFTPEWVKDLYFNRLSPLWRN